MKLEHLESIKKRVASANNIEEDHKAPRILVGMGTCGIKAGAAKVLSVLQESLKKSPNLTVTGVGCLGLCWMEPVVQVKLPGQEPMIFGNVTPEKAMLILKKHILLS